MSKTDFDLFSGLTGAENKNVVGKGTAAKPRKKPGPKKNETPMTQHAFRIYDHIWADLECFIKLNGGNQNKVVNQIFQQVVEDNKEKIEQYKALTEQ